MRDGNEVAVIRDFVAMDRDFPWEIYPFKPYGPYDSLFVFERYAWPEKTRLARCSIFAPYPIPRNLIISPRNDLAIFQWWHQGECGVEFIAIEPDGSDHQIEQSGFSREKLEYRPWFDNVKSGVPAESFVCTQPCFSPSGRYIAFGQEAYKQLVPPHIVGSILILNWDMKEIYKALITDEGIGDVVEIEEKGRPILQTVQYLDETTIEVQFATGLKKVILLDLPDEEMSGNQ